jgi:thioredoxin 1
MSQGIVHVTDESFENEVLKSDSPVLVLKIAKLNIDENPDTPPKYGIRGIPTLMLFKNGHVEATKVGALSKSQLSAFLDGNL